MQLKPTPIAPHQWEKVVKALYYSFASGFVGGFTLAVTGALSALTNGGTFSVNTALVTALVVGGVVGGLNTLAVTVKQLFTTPTPPTNTPIG